MCKAKTIIYDFFVHLLAFFGSTTISQCELEKEHEERSHVKRRAAKGPVDLGRLNF